MYFAMNIGDFSWFFRTFRRVSVPAAVKLTGSPVDVGHVGHGHGAARGFGDGADVDHVEHVECGGGHGQDGGEQVAEGGAGMGWGW